MSDDRNTPEAMKFDYYVRWFKDGHWKSVNVQELTEEEFRQYICWKIGLVGMKKNVDDLQDDV